MDNYIQLKDGYLSLPDGANFPITLEQKSIISGKASGGHSQSLTIDGTSNNAKLLGLYFDVDLTNETFDRNKKTSCTVVQNGTEVFTGYIQLMKVTRVNKLNSDNSRSYKYKINVFDEVGNFFVKMGESLLSDLKFPELTHVFNRSNVIDSWNNTEGYIYPQYATDMNYYTLKEFKPAIFELDYFKKIFAYNGYTYTFDQFDDESIRLDKRIIPFNGKPNEIVNEAIKQNYTVEGIDNTYSCITDEFPSIIYMYEYLFYSQYVNNDASYGSVSLDTVISDTQSQWDGVNELINNDAGDDRTWTFLTSYSYELDIRGLISSTPTAFEVDSTAGYDLDIIISLVAWSVSDPLKRLILDTQVAHTFSGGTTENFVSGYSQLATGTNESTGSLGLFAQGEDIKITPIVRGVYKANGQKFNNSQYVDILTGAVPTPIKFQDGGGTEVDIDFDISLTDVSIKAYPDISELKKGSVVPIEDFIPQEIKQRDVISSLQKSYNLVFLPDNDDETNIIIQTRDTYYDDGEELDLTELLAEDKDVEIEFVSDESNKSIKYTYAEDDDVLNEAYQNNFKDVYGTSKIELDSEYISGEDKRELIYSPTPSIEAGIGVVLPSINGIEPDNNIRVLLNNGKKTVSPYSFYDDTAPNGTPLNVTEYLHTSMFDSDEIPNFSILFNSPRVLFHTFQKSQTSNYIYNLHHVREVTTLNEGKRMNAYFKIDESLFQKFSKKLNQKIYIRNYGWFTISKVSKYNAIKKTLTKLELITADDLTRTKIINPYAGIEGNKEGVTTNFYNEVGNSTNDVKGTGVIINGKYNYVEADDVTIFGNFNEVRSSNVSVEGNSNKIQAGSDGSRIIGNNEVIDKPTTYIDGNSSYDDYSSIISSSIPATFTKVDFSGVTSVSRTETLLDIPNSRVMKMRRGSIGSVGVSLIVDSSGGSSKWVEFQLRGFDIDETELFQKRGVTYSLVKNLAEDVVSVSLDFYFGDPELEYFELWWRGSELLDYEDLDINVKKI